MPWPPTVPPTNRTNATLQLDAHPSDHNAAAQALTDIVTRVGTTQAWAPPVSQNAVVVAGVVEAGWYTRVGDVMTAELQWRATAAGSTGGITVPYPAGIVPRNTANLPYAGKGYLSAPGTLFVTVVRQAANVTFVLDSNSNFFTTPLVAGYRLTFTMSYFV